MICVLFFFFFLLVQKKVYSCHFMYSFKPILRPSQTSYICIWREKSTLNKTKTENIAGKKWLPGPFFKNLYFFKPLACHLRNISLQTRQWMDACILSGFHQWRSCFGKWSELLKWTEIVSGSYVSLDFPSVILPKNPHKTKQFFYRLIHDRKLTNRSMTMDTNKNTMEHVTS